MLSWASYLFGSATEEPKTDEDETVDMEPEVTKDKEWVVVEHTGNDQAQQVGITDLENLLIEHPSMSVYKRSGSDGEDSNASSSSELVNKSKTSRALDRPSPKRLRQVSARAELLAQVSQVKHAQKMQRKCTTRCNNKRNLNRGNKVATCDKHVSRKRRVRKPSGQMNGRISQRKQ